MLSTVLTRLWGDHNKKKTCGNRAAKICQLDGKSSSMQ